MASQTWGGNPHFERHMRKLHKEEFRKTSLMAEILTPEQFDAYFDSLCGAAAFVLQDHIIAPLVGDMRDVHAPVGDPKKMAQWRKLTGKPA